MDNIHKFDLDEIRQKQVELAKETVENRTLALKERNKQIEGRLKKEEPPPEGELESPGSTSPYEDKSEGAVYKVIESMKDDEKKQQWLERWEQQQLLNSVEPEDRILYAILRALSLKTFLDPCA